MYELKKKLERYLRVNLLGPGRGFTKVEKYWFRPSLEAPQVLTEMVRCGFPEKERSGLETDYLRRIPNLKMVGAVSPFLHTPSRHAQGWLLFCFQIH